MNLEIPQDLAQAVADYLSRQPYREVAGLMAALSQLKPVDAAPKPEASEPPRK
jgi:hypothetical protein